MNAERGSAARALALAARAAFDIAHADCGVSTGVEHEAMVAMAYMGTLMSDELVPNKHGVEQADECLPSDPDERLHEVYDRHARDLGALDTRLSFARAALACADVVLTQAWQQIRGEGKMNGSMLEALGSALDAFAMVDESLPRVDR